MTAEEIRKEATDMLTALKGNVEVENAPTRDDLKLVIQVTAVTSVVFFLSEIAAQLAELNKGLDPANLKELMRIQRDND